MSAVNSFSRNSVEKNQLRGLVNEAIVAPTKISDYLVFKRFSFGNVAYI